MNTEWVEALRSLPITNEEESEELRYRDYFQKHNDPIEAAKEISDKHPMIREKCIDWTERRSKTEYEYYIFRTGESEWTCVMRMVFLD